MSKTWTSALKSISISKLTKVSISGVNRFTSVDEFSDIPFGYFFKGNNDMAEAFDLACMYHDAYMASDCSFNESYLSKKSMKAKKRSILLGTVSVTTTDSVGNDMTKRIPLAFVSATRIIKPNSIKRASVRGLYAGRCLVCIATSNTEDTFYHEMVHAVMDSIPSLKEEMYGANAGDQREEMAAHFYTDHRSMFRTLDELKFETVVTKQQIDSDDDDDWDDDDEDCDGKKKPKGTVETTEIVDIKHNGKSLVGASISVSCDDKDIQKYRETKIEEYNL